MTSIIKYFLENPIVGNVLMLLLFVLGILGMLNMKTTLVPEIESRFISVQCIYPGASPQELEEGVTTKIEEGLKSLNGIERTTSVSSENLALITIEILKGFEPDLVLRDVKNAVDQIPNFPVGMEPPIIAKEEYQGFAINFSLSGDTDLTTLKQFAREVEQDLLQMDGISKIAVSGFPEEEIEISFREEDLRRYQLTFDQAVNAVRGSNLEVTGGKIKSPREELSIRARNKRYNAWDLHNLVIRTNGNGGVLRLYEVADVVNKWEDVPARSYLNDQAAVIITVSNTLQEDMLSATEKVRDYLEDFNRRNSLVQATIIDDGSVELNERIQLMTENGIIGFVLVIIILALFLNWRLAFWVALAIPISFAGTFIFAGALGVTINMMSLFGMIIVVGILVDDGIVIAENIYQKYEAGMPRMEAALKGTMEVLPAVFSAILTTVVAFSGFFFIDGRMGEFGIELAIMVIISLIFSLIEGTFILPAHVAHSKALKDRDHKPKGVLHWFNGLMIFLRDRTYRPVLRFAMRYSFPMIAICVAGFALLIGAFEGGIIRNTFFPNMPSEVFFVELKMPAGTSSEMTAKTLNRISAAASELNATYSQEKLGGEKELFTKIVKNMGPAANEGQIRVSMLSVEDRGTLTERDAIAMLREKVGPLYEAETLQYRFRSPFGNPIELSILGNDYAQLDKAALEIEEELKQMVDLRDVVNVNAEGSQEINLVLKPQAHNLGFTLMDVVRQVRQGFFGSEIQNLQRGPDEVKVWARYQIEDRTDLGKLAQMRIQHPSGISVPLEELAHFSFEKGVNNIYHLDGQREIKIEADVADNSVSIAEVLAQIEGSIVPNVLSNYPGLEVKYGGESREEEKTKSSMYSSLYMIFLLMFFIIVLTFKSVSQALIVFALIPFGYIGIGLGHYLMDVSHSTASLLGASALLGVLVNDALVFITTFNDKIRNGQPFEKALYATGMSRFRPIVLTSITTIVGLGPILLEKSRGAQLLIPMAISVAFGLMIVTIIILALVPALLNVSNGIKVWALSLWEGETLSRTSVEPSLQGRKQNALISAVGAILSFAAFFALALITLKISELLF